MRSSEAKREGRKTLGLHFKSYVKKSGHFQIPNQNKHT
jgi:hypothetical protein